jgi:hypothetical protein
LSTKEMEVLTKDGGVVMGDNVDLRAERKGSGIRSLKRRSSISKTTSRALPAQSYEKAASLSEFKIDTLTVFSIIQPTAGRGLAERGWVVYPFPELDYITA